MRRALCDADVFLEDKRLYLCSHRLYAECIACMCHLNIVIVPLCCCPFSTAGQPAKSFMSRTRKSSPQNEKGYRFC